MCLAALLLAAPGDAAGDYTIDAVMPLTGPAAFVGKLESEALRAYEGVVNRSGEIRGLTLHFAIHDDQSSPQVAVQLANRNKHTKPAVLIGSSIVAMCAAMAPLMLPDGPVQYCLSPGFSPKPDGYAFASSVSLDGITPATLRYLRLRGFTRLAVMSATDASAQEADRVTLAMFGTRENTTLRNVAYEHFNNADISVTAQIERIKAAAPQAMIVYASGPAFVSIGRSMKDGGLEIPVMTSIANLVPVQLAQYRDFLPPELLFNGFAYEAAGIEPTPIAALSWDPAKLLVAALRSLGAAATAPAVRQQAGRRAAAQRPLA